MTLDPQLVHRHAPGLRALVRELVLDDSRVDDVLQETWLRALHESPQSPAAFGAWIRTVARRLAFRQKRSENRRRNHESQLPPADDDLPRPDQIVEREFARRQVVDAVLQLDEPYRTAILYRFLENRSAGEVAEHLGIPLETLRTRLKRGLALLRGVLDREHEGHAERWHRALLPLATLPLGPWSLAATASGTAATTSWLGGLWTGGQLLRAALLLIALGVLGASGWLAWSGSGGVAVDAPAVVSFSAEELAAVPASGSADELEPSRRALLYATAEAAPPLAAPTRRYRIEVSGRAVDLNRRPLAGVEVALSLRPAPEVVFDALRTGAARPDRGLTEGNRPALLLPRTCTTGPDGRFRFVGPAYEETELAVRLRHPEHATRNVEARWHHLEDRVEFGDVPLQSGHPLAGQVVDAKGDPCPGVLVSARPARARRDRGPSVTDDVLATTTTDLAGRFRFAHLPPAGAVSLLALDPQGVRSATVRASVSAEPGSVAPEPVLVLPLARTVHCSLVWSDGTPAADLPVLALPFDPRLVGVLLHGAGADPRGTFLPEHRTDRRGTAEVRVPADSRWLLWVGTTPTSAAWHATSPRTILGPFDADATPGPLTIDRGWTVAGRLVPGDGLVPGGEFLAGSLPERVLLTPRRWLRGSASLEARVAEDGSFRFEGVRTEGFGRANTEVRELCLPDDRHRFAHGEPPRIEIPGSAATDTILAIEPAEVVAVPPARLRVLTSEGQPLAGAELHWSNVDTRRGPSRGGRGGSASVRMQATDPRAVITDAEGRAAMPRPEVTPPTLVVRRPDGMHSSIMLQDLGVAVDPAPAELVVRFPATTTLVGKVIGLGAEGRALVRVVDGASSVSSARPVRGNDAEFRFDSLPSGSYDVWIEPRDSAPATRLATLQLEGDEVEITLDAREARHGRIAGTLEVVGLPADATVRLRFSPRSDRPWVLGHPAPVEPDAAGNFEIERLPPGPGVLTAVIDRPGNRRSQTIHSELLTIDANRVHTVSLRLAVAHLRVLLGEGGAAIDPDQSMNDRGGRRRGGPIWILRDVVGELPDVPIEPGDSPLLPAREWLLIGVDGQTAGAVSLLPGTRSELRLPTRPESTYRDPERRPDPEPASRRESR